MRALNIEGPMVQLFVHDTSRTTTFTFVNFPSLFAPRGATSYRYVVEGRGPDGSLLGRRRTLTVPAFGATQIGVAELFGADAPPCGTIHVSLHPTSRLSRRDVHLGRLTPHFYALYHDPEMRFLALVHPQTTVWEGEPWDRAEWWSNLLVDTRLTRTIEAFQVNPTARPATSELRVHGERGDVLLRTVDTVPPFGVRHERWSLGELDVGAWASIGADRLAAPNAKPIVFMTNHDGLVTGCHS